MIPKVLIADDERDVLELLKFHLLKEGYEVETAANGLEALEKAQALLPDAILLDLLMPELDGTAVTEMLRRLPSTSAIPIVMLTACHTDATRLIASSAGVNEYLTKPFSPREVMACVRNALKPAVIRFGDEEFPESVTLVRGGYKNGRIN